MGVEAWDRFCEEIQRAGRELLQAGGRLDDVNRAEGLRYLTRLLRGGLERYIEYADPLHPEFFKLCHERLKVGGDNPDNLYLYCRISGEHDYRIVGQRGSVHYISISAAHDRYSSDGKQITTGFLDNDNIVTDSNGGFEITVGRNARGENALMTTADTNALFIRQTFLRRDEESEAAFSIERTSHSDAPTVLGVEPVREGLESATSFFSGTSRMFLDWALRFQSHVNELPPADQDYIASVGGDANIFYYLSAWAVGEGEVLLIHLPEVPECETWNFQLCNFWLESLDYTKHRIHVNKETAKQNPDGGVTIAVAERDPGLPNWLACCGHRSGTMCFRWVKAERVVHPWTELVAADRAVQ